MRRATVILVAVLMLFTAVLSGCSGSSGTGGGKLKGKISFMDVSPRPEREQFFRNMITEFNKEYPDVEVDYQTVPWDDAATKLTNMAAAKQLPDVINIYTGWIPQFVAAEWMIPLDTYLDNAGIKDKFTAFTKGYYWAEQQEIYGHIYSIPDGLMSGGIFVRKDWMEEKNIELSSWTWDDYFYLIEALTDPEQNRYGSSYRGARGAFDRIREYLVSFTEGRMYDDEGNCLLYSEENVERFIKFTDVYMKGYAPKDAINWGFTEMVDNFTGGLTGTLNNDTEVVAICQERMEDSQWTVLPLPASTVDGKTYGASGASYGYAVSSFSKNQDAAWAFIEFLSRPENNAEYCKVMTLIPIRTDVENDPFFSEEGPMAGFLAQVNDPNFVVMASYGPFDYTDLHQGPLHAEVQLYLQGKQSADETLKKLSDELASRMKAYLKDNPGTIPQPKSLVSGD
ncbi:MAG TPA: sugar ABC transporter substrate-binding protein [Clostridiales bacterium]|nr:sugar ABC transporter substrate-binding protein [Clostridiales bacterium]